MSGEKKEREETRLRTGKNGLSSLVAFGIVVAAVLLLPLSADSSVKAARASPVQMTEVGVGRN